MIKMNLTLARVIGLLAALGAGLSAFSGALTSSGGYKAAGVAAFSAIVAVWLHEEHATERNATTAAANMTPAPPAQVHPADAAAAAQAATQLLSGMLPPAKTTASASPQANAAPTTDASTGQPAPTP